MVIINRAGSLDVFLFSVDSAPVVSFCDLFFYLFLPFSACASCLSSSYSTSFNFLLVLLIFFLTNPDGICQSSFRASSLPPPCVSRWLYGLCADQSQVLGFRLGPQHLLDHPICNSKRYFQPNTSETDMLILFLLTPQSTALTPTKVVSREAWESP